MRNLRSSHIAFTVLLGLALPAGLDAGTPALAADPSPDLPASMTAAERAYLRDHFDEYLNSKRAGRSDTATPLDVVPAPAEFEPVDGIVYAWTQFPAVVRQLVKLTARTAKAYVAVKSSSEIESVKADLAAAGCNMDNVVVRQATLNSVWIRDYGPNFVHTRDGDVEMVDLVYNRPRPADDNFSPIFAGQLKMPVHRPRLILPGGNIIFDGQGCVILTDMVFDSYHGSDPNITQEQLAKYMKDYFGCHKVIVLEQMKEDGTGHVDMFCKLLNETTVIVGEYAKPSDGASENFDILNRNAEKLRGETNGAGQPFRVIRMPMPKFDGSSYTYTNSIMLNDTVLVPVYNKPMDEQALGIYRSLLPGHQVIGVDSTTPIRYNGAIHCISHEVNKDPFTVNHTPVARGDAGTPLTVAARIESVRPVDPSKVTVHWRVAGSTEFAVVPMTGDPDAAGAFGVELPAQLAGTNLEYYIRAEDVRGMHETSPEDASSTAVHSIAIRAALPGLSMLIAP
jgi:agmatine deiminase